MRILGATAAAGAAALLLGVAGADTAARPTPAGSGSTGPELVAQAAIGLADLRPPAPAGAPAPAARHVPVPPKPEAVKVAPGPLGIPGAAYAAYKAAADRMALEAPGCGIEWNLVAAIGRIESGHADGGNVDAAANTLTPIEGPVLDGTLAGNAVIRDGAGFARALGPMQFLTTTWSLFGGDNNGDGKADVHNLRDAAYGAARYLCSSASGLAAESSQRVAVFAYNQSESYVDNVVAWSKAYRDRAIPVGGIPDMAAPVAPPSQLPKPLPPGKVVVVACGTPDDAPSGPARPSAPGAARPTPGGPVPPSTPAAKPTRPAAPSVPGSSAPAGPSSVVRGPDGKPVPAAECESPSSAPSAPGRPGAPSGPAAPAPAAPGGALAISPSGPPPPARPAPSSTRPVRPGPRPAPAPSVAKPPAPGAPVPSSSPTVPRPPR